MKKTRELISNRFAVSAIVVVLLASTLGWLSSELIPPDFRSNIHLYEKGWGKVASRIVLALQLYDPFHSIWYRVILIFFFFTLLLCVLSNWKRFLRPYVGAGIDSISIAGRVDRWNVVSASWRRIKAGENMGKDPVLWYGEKFGVSARIQPDLLPDLLRSVKAEFKARGYGVKSIGDGSSIRFSAEKGKLRYAGSFGLHIAVLVIAVGGLIGSFFGWSEIMYGRPGDVIPLGEGKYSLRVEEFRVDVDREGAISDFVTLVSIWNGRDSLSTAAIRVNHPLSVAGLRVLQHSYHTEEDEFEWAKIGYRMGRELLWKIVVLKPGERVFLADSSVSVRILKFFPDFRMTGGRAFTGRGYPDNPAVRIEVEAMGSRTSGWLFLKYPRFNSDFEAPISFSLSDVKPVFYTGLEITRNPGSLVVMVGLSLGTTALLLLLLFNYRKIVGELGVEGFYMKGVQYQWKESFRREFRRITEDVIDALSETLKGVRIDEIDD